MLTAEEEAVAVAFRKHTLLPLDDRLCVLQKTIPHLTRSALHRCFPATRHQPTARGRSDKAAKKVFKRYASTSIAEVRTEKGKLYLFAAVDRTSKYAFARRLKTLRGLTPYKAICKAWADEPDRFRLDPST